MNVEKISVALDKETLRRLQMRAKSEGVSRSRLIQMAVSEYLAEFTGKDEEVFGILNLVYEEDGSEEITSVEHQYEATIISTLHVHVNERLCMEAIAVKGKRYELENLARRLSAIGKVKKAKLLISLEV
ncbi:putative nickel-responsive regulator [Metallosphaera sp. J1]|uniref:CopG family ribbon-helix-helix protein n=1 Tax=Metallosphaera javensis (ex Hofmann et al. 2022) TaxID=99938 RepID=UPI001EDE7E9E|nr:CopG family ribbon-helix-helix protein [Metallosphaera javensis (ex Hofmann et al. 2022)]MCG3108613.1 putative nickel-responsive regulator [Metallosphaera javensis (ex Hofmann et al. 2022)]